MEFNITPLQLIKLFGECDFSEPIGFLNTLLQAHLPPEQTRPHSAYGYRDLKEKKCTPSSRFTSRGVHCSPHKKEEIAMGEGKSEGILLWGILLLHMETGALGDVYHWVVVKCLAQYPVHGK